MPPKQTCTADRQENTRYVRLDWSCYPHYRCICYAMGPKELRFQWNKLRGIQVEQELVAL